MTTACQAEVTTSLVAATATLFPFSTPAAMPSSTPFGGEVSDPASIGPSPTPFVHIIQQGETLLGVALRYGVSLEDLILVNPGVDPGFLTIGQQLRIPGKEGEAVDLLLPSPTPVPVELSAVDCYEGPSELLTCILEARNNNASTIRGLSVVVRLFDRDGNELNAELVNSPLERIEPGQRLPLAATFSQKPAGFSSALATTQSAIQIIPSDSTPVPETLKIQSSEQVIHAFNASIAGTINIVDPDPVSGQMVRVVGIVRKADGLPVGYKILDLNLEEGNGGAIPYTMNIFSLGPPVISVEVFAELLSP